MNFLPGRSAAVLLAVIWSLGALLVLFRVFWLGAPRWLYAPVRGHGLPLRGLPPGVLRGQRARHGHAHRGRRALHRRRRCYALKRPRLRPATFSFHEVFHACTIGGFVCHYISIMLAMFAG